MASNVPAQAPAFGDLLRQHRRARALTQEALAEGAGISARAISDLERGARSFPYRETVRLLADALALDESERAAFLAAARRSVRADRPPSPLIYLSPGACLPRPFTTFVGRDHDLTRLVLLLRDDRLPLLTLTGPGGVGKTRLAVAAATRLEDAFPDGIVFIDLAPLLDPALFVPAVAAALGLNDRDPASLLERVVRILSTRHILLLLDNFEHLLEAAPAVSALVRAGPRVQALVTSRAPLRLQGERTIPLAPMPAPDPGLLVGLGNLARWDAMRLFEERAREALPDFRLTADNAADVAAICQRLDGLPLAIELAAPKMKLLSPAMLLDRLEQRLPLLTGGTRDSPARHRTLQAAIAWSYDLLAPEEQTLLLYLSIFPGGWTMEAAETIGPTIGVPNVLGGLTALAEQSLIVRRDDGPHARYRMLETVREFAADRLQAAGEADDAHRAMSRHLLALTRDNTLERIDAALEGRLNRLRGEDANLLAGIAWATEHDPDAAVTILCALGPYCSFTDRTAAGRAMHERVLETADLTSHPGWAKFLRQAAWFMMLLGDFAAAAPLVDAAFTHAEQDGDRQTMAFARMCQGSIAMSRGEIADARVLHDRALAEFAALDDAWAMAVCLTEIGIAALDRGDAAAAAAYFERIGALGARHYAPNRLHAHVQVNLADAYRQLGDAARATAACHEALALNQAGGSRATNATAWHILGRLMLEQGDISHAAALLAQSLRLFWEFGDRWNLAQALEAAGAILTVGQRPAAAIRCLGAASALRQAMPYPLGASDRVDVERSLARLRTALAEPAFSNGWEDGKGQSLDDAVADAEATLLAVAAS